MSNELYEGAAALVWRHTGATRAGGAQTEANLCLGGLRSDTDIASFTVHRRAAQRDIRILRASAATSGGASLRATDTNDLAYTPPEQVQGDSVAILNGETKKITGTPF